ncbi:MAG TPA: hypothetical protein VGK74_28550 [Symbiobacteriaceae bacterium]|jgi:hypothetical protein
MSEQKTNPAGYVVKCGDGTGGRVSADSPDQAEAMAEEMCRVHDGVSEKPKPRPER